MKLNVQGHLNYIDCDVWRVYYEQNTSSGISGLRKLEKMSLTMLILVARVRQQPMKTLKQ